MLLNFFKNNLIFILFSIVIFAADVNAREAIIPLVWNIPLSNKNFVGRHKYLNFIHEYFINPNNQVLAIVGAAGVGKTQIAKKYTDLYKSEYDIIWWIDAGQDIPRQYKELAGELNRIILPSQIINLYNDDNEFIVNSVKDRLRTINFSWLLIFDNVSIKEDIDKYIPEKHNNSSKGNILITSKNLIVRDNVQKIEKFSRDESIELMSALTDIYDMKLLGELCQLLNDYPLAIAQAGAYIRINHTISIKQYVDLYKTIRRELWKNEENVIKSNQNDNLIDNYKYTMATTLALSLEELKNQSPKAYDLLIFCSFLANEVIPLDLLKSYFNYDELSLNKAISDLINYSLLTPQKDEKGSTVTYTMHDMQQLAIQDTLTLPKSKTFVQEAINHLAKIIPTQLDLSIPLLTDKSYVLQQINVLSEYAERFQINNDGLITLYLRKLEYFLPGRRDSVNSLYLIDKLESIFQKTPSATKMSIVRFNIMKSAYLAWFEANYNLSIDQAIKTIEYLENYPEAHEEYLMLYNRLAQSYILQGDIVNALKYSDLGMEVIKNASGYLGNQDAFYGGRARIFEDKGKFKEAYDLILLSIEKCNKGSNILEPIPVMSSKAYILAKMGDYKESYKIAGNALSQLEKLSGDRDSIFKAPLLAILSYSLYGLADLDVAEENIKQSLSIFKRLYNGKKANRAYAYAYMILGDILVARGEQREAQDAFLESRKIYTDIFSKLEIDEISDLYSKLAINSAMLGDEFMAAYYFNLHKDTFGKAHERTFKIINFLYENKLPLP
jgi:tetratricopeptide (TPR) repeat protein